MIWAFYHNAKYKLINKDKRMKLLGHIGELIAILLIRISYKEPKKCKDCTKTGDEESLCCQTYKL